MSQERDQAIAHGEAIQAHNADFAQLQAENQRLKSAHTSLMTAYNQLLANGHKQAIAPPPVGTVPTNSSIAPALQSSPVPKTPKQRVSTADGGAIARALRLFRAVQDWNDQHPQATFAITASLLKREFAIHDEAIKAFFEQHQPEIEDYHQSIGVSNPRSHNRQSGKDPEQLKQFVQSQAQDD